MQRDRLVEGVVSTLGQAPVPTGQDRAGLGLDAAEGTVHGVERGGGDERADQGRVVEGIAAGRTAGFTGYESVTDPVRARQLWRIREDGAGLDTRLPGGTSQPPGAGGGSEAWPGWEDAAVPPDQLGSYLRRFTELLSRHQLQGAVYGHFGEGCLHVRITFDFTTEHGTAVFRAFVTEAAELVTAHGGSLSGEHGDGQSEFLHHHSKGRLRPASHYSMGWLPLHSRIAARMPRLINALTASRLAPTIKRLGGIPPDNWASPTGWPVAPPPRSHRPCARAYRSWAWNRAAPRH
ncbi:hypothetical protein JCM4914_01760 [Streptomyces platensis subsp. malvinus]